MEGKGFAFRLLPFLAAKQTENLMYGTVFEVGFASGPSFLDNTGITSIPKSAFRPVFISVQVTFKRGKPGGWFWEKTERSGVFCPCICAAQPRVGFGAKPRLKMLLFWVLFLKKSPRTGVTRCAGVVALAPF